MWISRKEYKFLKENAEKNINAECEILRVKENQSLKVAKAMEEYSAVLEERDKLKQQLAYYEDLKEQGRLIILNIEDIYPCKHCGVGWGSISSEGCETCHDTCERLKQYNNKYRNIKT